MQQCTVHRVYAILFFGIRTGSRGSVDPSVAHVGGTGSLGGLRFQSERWETQKHVAHDLFLCSCMHVLDQFRIGFYFIFLF